MSNVTLPALKAQLKRLGITQDVVAAQANVTRPLVVNVFAGRSTSAKVVATAKRLIAEAKANPVPRDRLQPTTAQTARAGSGAQRNGTRQSSAAPARRVRARATA